MSSVTIIDNHSGYHGKYVTECVKENWDGQINKIDLGSNRVNISEIVECLNEAADKVETWNTIALNMSFGGGLTDDPDDTPENVSKAIRRLYRKGVSLFFSAGNEGWGMLVSKLASHPLVFAVGALTDEGEISTYSNRSPRLVSMFADGYYNERDVKGTSFSSPLLCGSCASVINRLGVNDLQLRTILKNVSPIFTVYRDSEPDGFASYQKLNESFMKIVSGSVISDETLLFDCYEVFAGRTPDKNGFDYWNGRRINGENIEDLLVEMANGMKYAGDWMNDRCTVVPKLQSLYHLFLNREADLSGIMHYVNYLQGIDNNNGTFICSDENSENWKQFIHLFCGAARQEGLHREWLLNLIEI